MGCLSSVKRVKKQISCTRCIPKKIRETFKASIGFILALTTHMLFGTQAVFSRFMQRNANVSLPSLSLVVMAYGSIAIIFSIPAIYRVCITPIFRRWKKAVSRLENESVHHLHIKQKRKKKTQSFAVDHQMSTEINSLNDNAQHLEVEHPEKLKEITNLPQDSAADLQTMEEMIESTEMSPQKPRNDHETVVNLNDIDFQHHESHNDEMSTPQKRSNSMDGLSPTSPFPLLTITAMDDDNHHMLTEESMQSPISKYGSQLDLIEHEEKQAAADGAAPKDFSETVVQIPQITEDGPSKTQQQQVEKKKKKKITLDMKCRAFGSSIRYSLFKEFVRYKFFLVDAPIKLKIRLIWEWFFFHIAKIFYSVSVSIRSVSNMYGAKYTKATFISLLGLLIPFFTIFYFIMLQFIEKIVKLGIKLFSMIFEKNKPEDEKNNDNYGFPKQIRTKLIEDEKLSFTAIFAMTMTCLGGGIIIIGGLAPKSKEICLGLDYIFISDLWKGHLFSSFTNFFSNLWKWFKCYFKFLWNGKLDFSTLSDNLTTNDLIGLGITMISNISYCFYMFGLKWVKTQKQPVPVQIFLTDGVVDLGDDEEEQQEKLEILKKEKKELKKKKEEPSIEEKKQKKKNMTPIKPKNKRKKFSKQFQEDLNKKKSRPPLLANADNFFIYQATSISIPLLFISLLIGEDWSLWLKLNLFGWIVFVIFVGVVYIGANYVNIWAVQLVGASVISSTQALRLISTISLSTVLLGEGYKTYWEIFGTAMTLVAVTWFVLVKNKDNDKKKKWEKEKKGKTDLEIYYHLLEESKREHPYFDVSLNRSIF